MISDKDWKKKVKIRLTKILVALKITEIFHYLNFLIWEACEDTTGAKIQAWIVSNHYWLGE